jgi:hypothetical protein
VAALNGHIYVAGGHMPGGQATATLQRFDPLTNQWVTLAPMPGPRAELQLVAANGRLYAIGGETGNGTQTPVATVEQYDPISNEWATRAPMSSPRMFFAAGALNNDSTIIVAGGSGSSVELYNIATNTWSTTSPLQVSMAAGATIANRFYVATQCGSFVYRPAEGSLNEGWARMPDMLSPRNEFAVAVSGDVMYAAGGFIGSNPSSPVATFNALSTPPPGDLAYNQSGASCPGGGGGGSNLPTVQWSSSDQSIAGISTSGQATGNAPGQATIVATAAGVSCQTTNSCATLTVTQPTHITFTLAPGSSSFNSVTVTIVDRVTGQAFDTFDVPIGAPQELSPEEADQIRILIAAPAGYQVSPTEVEPNLHNGDLFVPLLFTFVDTTPPVITVPANITVDATSGQGAIVAYSALATDNVDGTLIPICLPPPGMFPIGTTTVSCTATDAAGNAATATFTVHVRGVVEQVTVAVCNGLATFIEQTRSQIGRRLTAAQANQLIAAAQRIRVSIGCH